MLKTRGPTHIVVTTIRFLMVVICALPVLLLPHVAAGQAVVGGQNNPAVDVPAVQAAVDQGGSVLLVGTFDFGDAGRVLLRKDVDISGEIVGNATPVTTIRGGDWPFYSPLPAQMPPTQPGPKVTVQYIHFDGAKGVAVHLAYTGGASVHNNKMTGLRGRFLRFGPDKRVNFRRNGVVIGPFDSRPQTDIQITPLLVSGSIEVFDNDIDSSGAEDSTVTNAGAVLMAFIVGADIRIENNVNVGCTRNCIGVFDAIPDSSGRGSIVIANNTVISDVKVGYTVPGKRAPIGIDVSFNFNRTLTFPPERQHVHLLIADNYIELHGVNSMGIIAAQNGAAVVDNTVVVHADPTQTTDLVSTTGGIMAATSHQVVLRNKIMGEGWNAIRIGGNTLGAPRIDNVAIGNNISGFNAFTSGSDFSGSDFLLDVASASNTVVGNSGTVIDNGKDNKITGFKPVKGGVGQDVSDAEQYWHDVTEVLE